MKQQIIEFLDKLLNRISSLGINVADFKIDHVAYGCTSTREYETVLPKFLRNGKLVKEAIVSGRRVAIIKLSSAIKYGVSNIEAIEVIEPIRSQKSISGWEHAEFLVDDYDAILGKYPNLNWNLDHRDRPSFSRIKLTLTGGLEIKFLNTPVLVSAGQE